MFTGIIEETGRIKSVKKIGKARRFAVSGNKIFSDLKIDDSVAVNGVCQTVVSINGNIFEFDSVEETIRKTTLGLLNVNDEVNLERALRLSDRLGGHLVQGHVDTTGKVITLQKDSSATNIWIEFPKDFKHLIVRTGSITIDGVSLTVARLESFRLMVSVIPHTQSKTTIEKLKTGSIVNLEFDILGKYIENLLKSSNSLEITKSSLDQYIDQPLL